MKSQHDDKSSLGFINLLARERAEMSDGCA